MTLFGSTISPIYRGAFLLGELRRASSLLNWHPTRPGNTETFCAFQSRSMNQLDPLLPFEYLSVGVFDHANIDSESNREEERAISGLPFDELRKNYFEHAQWDAYSPQLGLDTGHALFIDSILPVPVMHETEIYRRHWAQFDIERMVSLSFYFPFNRARKFEFLYMRKDQDFPATLSEEYVEYVTFPFYLAWLCVYRMADPDELSEWLGLLVDMSLDRFRVLRALIWPDATSPLLQQRLGLGRKQIDKILSQAAGRMLEIKGHQSDGAGYTPRTHMLTQTYYFFRFGQKAPDRHTPIRRNGKFPP